MPFGNIKPMVYKFIVIFPEILCTCIFEQVITMIHQGTQTI